LVAITATTIAKKNQNKNSSICNYSLLFQYLTALLGLLCFDGVSAC
jgi:hypothetical protein